MTKRGYAVIHWTSTCPVSRNRNEFAALVRTLPSDATVEYFRSLSPSELKEGWHQGCQLILRSVEFSGTLDSPQVLSVESAPRITIDVNNNAS